MAATSPPAGVIWRAMPQRVSPGPTTTEVAPGATVELPNFGSVLFTVVELGDGFMIVEPVDHPGAASEQHITRGDE